MKHFTSTLGAMLAAAVLAAPTTTLALFGLGLAGLALGQRRKIKGTVEAKF